MIKKKLPIQCFLQIKTRIHLNIISHKKGLVILVFVFGYTYVYLLFMYL